MVEPRLSGILKDPENMLVSQQDNYLIKRNL